jgi:hypothetical protein
MTMTIICGELTIFNPSSTTYVKHFISSIVEMNLILIILLNVL